MRWSYRPPAAAEVEEAAGYYEAASPGLGRRFLADLSALLRRLDRFPEQGREVLPGVRQARLSRFPYSLYYSLRDDDADVLAVVHFARHERVWKQRVEADLEDPSPDR